MALLTVFVPLGGPCRIINGNAVYDARPFKGRMIIDVPQMFFRTALLGGAQGLDWVNENPEAMEWLQHDHTIMNCNAFPGADRPAPVERVAVEVKPVLIKMHAPDGVSAFSHEGTEHKVGKDGTILVEKPVADVLRAHGFRDAA
jgi:hypothetical protein